MKRTNIVPYLSLVVLAATACVAGESTSEASGSAENAAPSEPSQPAAAAKAADAPSNPSVDREGPLAIGAVAPRVEREMKSVDGSMASVASAAKDKGVLVIFTCNHCPWVKAWQERTVALGNEFLDQGVGVIAINSNDPAKNDEDSFDGMKKRANARSMKYPYVVDEGSVMARAYGATKTPEFFLFDADMKLVYHGAIDDNAQKPDQVKKTYLKDALTALVNGEPVSVAKTKALGCGIKFQSAS